MSTCVRRGRSVDDLIGQPVVVAPALRCRLRATVEFYSSPCAVGISSVGAIDGAGLAGAAPVVAGAGRPPVPRPISAQARPPAGPVPGWQAWRRADWPSASAPYGSQHGPAVTGAASPEPDPRLSLRRLGLRRLRSKGPAERALLLVVIVAAHAVGRHEAEDPAIARVDNQPAVRAAAVDRRDGVDEAAQPGDAERRETIIAQHGVDFRRRQQARAVSVARPGFEVRPGNRAWAPSHRGLDIRCRHVRPAHLRLRAARQQDQSCRQRSREKLHHRKLL